MRLRLLVIAAAAATFAAAPLHANPSCPETEMQFRSLTAFTSTEAAEDTTYPGGGGTWHVAYDLVAGRVEAHHCCSLGETHVIARDRYDVIGVPPGTPVTLTVKFIVDGDVFDGGQCGGSGCGGTLGMYVQHGADVDERVHSPALYNGARADYHDELSVPVTITAGQPEVIAFKIWGSRGPGGQHGADGQGTIHFEGLSPGMTVISCQGYSSAPTAARATSWGRLKTIYR